MKIGDQVKINMNGETLTGTVVSIYAVPKKWDIIDVDVDGVVYHGIKTDEVQSGV